VDWVSWQSQNVVRYFKVEDIYSGLFLILIHIQKNVVSFVEILVQKRSLVLAIGTKT